MQNSDVEINHRRTEARMSEQPADHQQIDAGFQKSGRIRMSERVGRHIFQNADFFRGHFEHLLNRRRTQKHVGRLAGKQILRRTKRLPVLAKLGQQSRRQRDKSRLLTLAAGDSQLHPLTVDVGDLQTRGFVESQTGGILSQQEDAMLVALHT